MQPTGRSTDASVSPDAAEASAVRAEDTRSPNPGSRRARRDTPFVGHLPPASLLIARPLLLLVAALLGGCVGLLLTGGQNYQSVNTLQFTVESSDSLVTKQTGQTLARTAQSSGVVSAAATARGEDPSELAKRISAEWVTDSRLITITATAPTDQQAIDDANAVATALVQQTEADIAARLQAAAAQSNQILTGEQLSSPDAEEARKVQVGVALGSRQDTIASETGAVTVADPASEANAAGLSRGMGVVIGAVAGLILGGLASLLLGSRGLRVRDERAVKTLLPDVRISAPAQAAQLAGQIVESEKRLVVVVTTTHADEAGVAFAKDVSDFLRAHGLEVAEVGPFGRDDRSAAVRMLRRERRRDLPSQLGADIAVAVVAANSDASALLEGQSDVTALVVARRGRTSLDSAMRAMESYERAQPTLVLAR